MNSPGAWELLVLILFAVAVCGVVLAIKALRRKR